MPTRSASTISFGWTGEVMSDGLLTPGQLDGMGVVVGAGNEIR